MSRTCSKQHPLLAIPRVAARWTAMAITFGAFVGVSVLLFQWLGYWALLFLAAGLFAGIAGFRSAWLARRISTISKPFVWSLHRTLWRPITAEFLTECRVPLKQLVEVLGADDDLLFSMFASETIAEDHALALYSNAVRSLD